MNNKNLLNLDGKALEKELDRIAKENPPRYAVWTEKEIQLLRKLRERRVQPKKIAQVMGRTVPSIENQLHRL